MSAFITTGQSCAGGISLEVNGIHVTFLVALAKAKGWVFPALHHSSADCHHYPTATLKTPWGSISTEDVHELVHKLSAQEPHSLVHTLDNLIRPRRKHQDGLHMVPVWVLIVDCTPLRLIVLNVVLLLDNDGNLLNQR